MSAVIRSPNWIGDGIMCLPALRAFKQAFPGERLAVAARGSLADLFAYVPEIDEILPLPERWAPGSFARTARRLRRGGFSRGVLFTNSFSSALFFRAAGIRSLAGYPRDGRSFLLRQRVPLPAGPEHHQRYYLRIVEHLAGRPIASPPPATLAVGAREREEAGRWLSGQGVSPLDPLLAVAPAAAFGGAKAWLPERFREFIRLWLQARPQTSVLLLGSPAERGRAGAVGAGLGGPVYNLAGRLRLREAIAVLSRCRLFVGNDSGLMHVAAALSVPLVAVFGPTEPGRTAPLAARFRLLHHGADCAPCRRRECPGDHRCMRAVEVGEVLAAAAELWEAAP